MKTIRFRAKIHPNSGHYQGEDKASMLCELSMDQISHPYDYGKYFWGWVTAIKQKVYSIDRPRNMHTEYIPSKAGAIKIRAMIKKMEAQSA